MSREIVQSVLRANREVLDQAVPSFSKSLEKCRSLNLAGPRSFEVEESLDALTSKFARVSDIFTQKVLKSLVLLTREDAPTFVDRMNLCEKLGVISSAADLIEIRDLRNQIAHEYLSDNLTEIYGDCLTLSEKLLTEIQVAHPVIERYLKSD
ncbi:MAG: hypothetical protein WCO97_04320 [bacterium]